MKRISHVVKKTLTSLKDRHIDLTPNVYHKEFCKQAKSVDLSVQECVQFKELVLKLSKAEQEEIASKNIEIIEDMIPILLNRIAVNNVNTLAELLEQSLTPSISLEIDENLAKFSLKIGNSPSLIFEEDIQKEIQDFINKRFEADKKIVKQKTADIAKLITLMSKYLNDAIDSSSHGSDQVANIKNEIESMDMTESSSQELSLLQSKLISAAFSIENEMSQVNKRLKDNKSELNSMQEKIKVLEKELDNAKKISQTDHLTGLLTRRAFEEELRKIESEYSRLNNNYAIIFFDLDHFKNINDTYGHEGGDVILATFAKILQKETREFDIVGRYGGEEFVATIHYNLKRELLKYLKRIKNIVSQNKFVYKENKIKVTFSAGVAIRDSHSSSSDTIQQADILLYKAKEAGRNRIILEDGMNL